MGQKGVEEGHGVGVAPGDDQLEVVHNLLVTAILKRLVENIIVHYEASLTRCGVILIPSIFNY